ncbi:MAG: sigma-70 family RNA polymerase sigma factor [Actinomycetota bacterium]|nr:sigma-70 family RNA polymerase sigma factor [Actinomycetota bacterium]
MDPGPETNVPAVGTVDLLEEELVRRYLPMTRRLAKRFSGRGADADDLLQVANLALIKAYRGFDADRGLFEAYAKVSISGALKRHLRDHCWTIRPPRRVQELQAQISKATDVMAQQGATLPTPRTLACYMEASVADITEALSARGCYTPSSLDEPVGQAGRTLSESLRMVEDPYTEVAEHLTLVQICRDLSENDRELIRLRFYECLSQREIATEIGVSQMQVSRLLARLMERLRQRALETMAA